MFCFCAYSDVNVTKSLSLAHLTVCDVVIDSIRLQNFFSPQIFTAVNNAISHLKGHKIYFLEEKKLSSWKLTIFLKNFSNH